MGIKLKNVIRDHALFQIDRYKLILRGERAQNGLIGPPPLAFLNMK
jgi:hypothetical protein